MDFSAMVSNLGFPIACVVVLGIWVSQQSKLTREDGKVREQTLLLSNEVIRKDSAVREKSLMDANKEFAVALNKASDAISENGKLSLALYERMHTVECKVDSVNIKVDSLKITLSQAVNEH